MTGQRPHRVLPGHRSTATKNSDCRYQKVLCATVEQPGIAKHGARDPTSSLSEHDVVEGGEQRPLAARNERAGHHLDMRGSSLPPAFSSTSDHRAGAFASGASSKRPIRWWEPSGKTGLAWASPCPVGRRRPGRRRCKPSSHANRCGSWDTTATPFHRAARRSRCRPRGARRRAQTPRGCSPVPASKLAAHQDEGAFRNDVLAPPYAGPPMPTPDRSQRASAAPSRAQCSGAPAMSGPRAPR